MPGVVVVMNVPGMKNDVLPASTPETKGCRTVCGDPIRVPSGLKTSSAGPVEL